MGGSSRGRLLSGSAKVIKDHKRSARTHGASGESVAGLNGEVAGRQSRGGWKMESFRPRELGDPRSAMMPDGATG